MEGVAAVPMTVNEALDRLDEGDYYLTQQRAAWDKRQAYVDGDQDLPYAPDGVNAEYEGLRKQSIANVIGLASSAPTQRIRADGFKRGGPSTGSRDSTKTREDGADLDIWRQIFQPNRLDVRQSPVYEEMFNHGRGVMGVWPNPREKPKPVVRPESSRNVWIQGDIEDPWTQEWAVKRINRALRRGRQPDQNRLWTPPSAKGLPPEAEEIAWVHGLDKTGPGATWMKFVRQIRSNGVTTTKSDWHQPDTDASGSYDLGGHLAFVPFDYRAKADAQWRSGIQALMPAQDAINTIRFQTLLALQFSAYRQRIVTGFDPVLRNPDGSIVPRLGTDGQPLLDANGQQIPIIVTPGRISVDRMLAFPGDATKIFDLPESNLDNYIIVLSEFLTQFFSFGQIPPQYMLAKIPGVSGDTLAAAESTLTSLVNGLKLMAGESLELVLMLANRSRGADDDNWSSEIIWANTEVRSFAQIIDGIVKLVTGTGMAPRDAWGMLPDATPERLEEWDRHAKERQREMIALGGVPLPGQTAGAPAARPRDGGAAVGAGSAGQAGRTRWRWAGQRWEDVSMSDTVMRSAWRLLAMTRDE